MLLDARSDRFSGFAASKISFNIVHPNGMRDLLYLISSLTLKTLRKNASISTAFESLENFSFDSKSKSSIDKLNF